MNQLQRTPDWIKYAVENDMKGLVDYFDELFLPRFSVSQVGISRQEMTYWLDKQILNKIELNENPEVQRSWGRLNFFSYAWIQIVIALRKMNVPLETIANLRKKIGDMDEKIENDYILSGFDLFKGPLQKQYPEIMAEVQRIIANTFSQQFIQLKQALSGFNVIILSLLTNQNPINILVQADGSFMLLNPVEGPEKNMLDDYISFTGQAFVSIPLGNLLKEFVGNLHIKPIVKQKIYNLTTQEVKVLELLNQDGIKEIRIRLSSKRKGQILIDVVKELSISKLEQRVRTLLDKAKVQNIRIYAEQGSLLLYEETTIVKLENNE